MKKIIFLVKGSTDEPYQVVFEKTDNNLKALCNCAAAKNGKHCKHRLRILNRDSTDIVSDNLSSVDLVCDWLKNTNLETAIEIFNKAEKDSERAKKQLTKAKKHLIKAML